MTRLPNEDRRVYGLPGEKPTLPEECFAPGCDVTGRVNLELHEAWPRSFLRNQPIRRVKLPDGSEIPNQFYLCNELQNKHHWMVTTNRARIVWDEKTRRFEWCQPLKMQP